MVTDEAGKKIRTSNENVIMSIYDQLFCEVGLFGPVAANRSPFLIYWNYESAVSKLKKQHSHLRNIPILKGKIQ